jgi:hypothetical protein
LHENKQGIFPSGMPGIAGMATLERLRIAAPPAKLAAGGKIFFAKRADPSLPG